MLRFSSNAGALALALVGTAAIGFGVDQFSSGSRDRSSMAAEAASPPARTEWAASAPGRVEPRGGEVRISAQTAGRIVDVPARLNEAVSSDDLLVRLDDADLQAKLLAAEAEVGVRKRDRDQESVGKAATDRRQAEDAVATAERNVFKARQDLDSWVAARRDGRVGIEDVTKAREALAVARDKLDQERANAKKVQATSGMPLPTRPEAALIAARAELSQVETAIERTRVRAPATGSVLQVAARVGEVAAPSPENALVVFGDLSALRVRAEMEERDVSKVRVGQKAVVRSDAFPERDFEGKVSAVAQSLGSPRLPTRGPRRPNDVDVLEVFVDLEGLPPLVSGMRVDVFLKPDSTASAVPAAAEAKPAAAASAGR